MTIEEWAQIYLDMDFEVVPLLTKTKHTDIPSWEKIKFQASDFTSKYGNIGIIPRNGIVTVDIDCPEGVGFADSFLPKTETIFGRTSKPRNKRIYRADIKKTTQLKDWETGKMILELRVSTGNGVQDMAPPSVHPDSGETLEWDREDIGTPTEVNADVLFRSFRLLATCILLSRYYAAAGARHDWTLAVCGTLKRLEVTEDEAVKLFSLASTYAQDSKGHDRELEVRSTFSKTDDEPTTGAVTLADLASEKFVTSLFRVWGKRKDRGEWVTNTKGAIVSSSQQNILTALKKKEVRLSFDLFSEKPLIEYEEYNGPLTDAIVKRLWLDFDDSFHFRPPKDFFYDVIENVAHSKPFHPVKNYLHSLEWDRTSRLDEWLIRGARAGDSEYTRVVSAITLIAAVRRIFQPGCKFDEMLVLESGQQGLFKSTAIRALCPNPDWFSDDLPLNVGSKEVIERTLGKWLIEASDLAGLRPAAQEHLKSALSRRRDGPVRMAYGRLPIERDRQFIIIGTTNSYGYLSDSTGNRRYWPILVEKFDIAWLKEHRDQLWAEAVTREAAGESIRLPESLYPMAALQQKRRTTEHPWLDVLTSSLGTSGYCRIPTTDLWEIVEVPKGRWDRSGAIRLSECMQALGFKRMTVQVEKGANGKRVAGWGRGTAPFGTREIEKQQSLPEGEERIAAPPEM